MIRKSSAGLTLAEAIIAVFVLLAGFVVMTRLFHTGLRYQTIVDNQGIAVMLAERQMERIRGWSRRVHKCPGGAQAFTNWSGCPGDGAPSSDPDFPGHIVEVEHEAHRLPTPCSLFEALYAASQQRVLEHSVRRVKITVRWGSQRHVLVSLVSMPTGIPDTTTLTLGAGPTTLPPDGQRTLVMDTRNADGRPLLDLTYRYAIVASNGNEGGGFGTTGGPRDGRTGVIRNCIYGLNPSTGDVEITGYGAGKCRVVGIGRYRGIEVRGESAEIEMRP